MQITDIKTGLEKTTNKAINVLKEEFRTIESGLLKNKNQIVNICLKSYVRQSDSEEICTELIENVDEEIKRVTKTFKFLIDELETYKQEIASIPDVVSELDANELVVEFVGKVDKVLSTIEK